MNHWYTTDSIATQHRKDLDRSAAEDALAKAAQSTRMAAHRAEPRQALQPDSPWSTSHAWKRRFLLRLLAAATTAEIWLEAKLSIADGPTG